MARQRAVEICTVALRRETAHVRVLAASLHSFHPGRRLTVLVLDWSGDDEQDLGPVEALAPRDLAVEDFEQLAALLPEPLLRAWARASLLRHLRSLGEGPLLYLDPWSRLYSPLDEPAALLGEGELLLTPALGFPLPDDGRRPDAEEFAASPTFDQGLIGVGGGGELARLLDWWADRSTADTLSGESPLEDWWADPPEPEAPAPAPAPGGGHWLDLVAGMAPRLHLLGVPSWNAGYWNLHGREVTRTESGYAIDGAALGSFNFRGFDPERPSLLSRDQDRISLADQPDLARLCAEYAAALQEQGIGERRHPDALSTLADGTPFSPRLRRLYREWWQSPAIAASPFTKPGQAVFFDWLREPAGPGGSSRYLYAAYLERPDVQRAIPVGVPDFAIRLNRWAAESGGAEMDIPAALMPGAPRGEAKRRPPLPGSRIRAKLPFDAWGVNVIGYHRADFGVAHAGRLAIEALDARGVPLLPIHDLSLQRHKPKGPDLATLGLESAGFPINLLCLRGDHTVELGARVGTSLFEDRYSIGLWFWEVDRLPDSWLPAFELLDEVWAPSAYVAEAVSESSPVPVTRVRLPVDVPPAPRLDLASYGVADDRFLFLYVFDFDSVSGRKNPLGAVEAFKEAFAPGSGAALLLKTSGAANAPADFEVLRQAVDEHPDIHLVDRRVGDRERDALLAGCDCYLSLHRSEGFGLTPAEAMAYGKPVIATALGGNTDFMDDRNSYPVDYRLVDVGEGLAPYPPEGRWAEPDTGHAARLMRQVREHPEEARERGAMAARELRRTHSPDAAGEAMEARLVEIRRRFLRPTRAAAAASRSTPPRRLLRRLLRRPAGEREPGAGEAPPPALSAALLAQARAQERRMREHEAARQGADAARA